ncbi:dimethylhistidine N-methyltransferase [Flavobacterium noncentrifugens]|uniref:Dimethylhistidine N-methyltransferase n=1 Tax=Flavobacterium noncentrifugens TaxID=1128970 RepID=A0A1G8URS0_9FLAO|nr:L-histidine N(alpha)-methyltransferase [Flavobacterium noncentrifugens]GEP52599.1 dimethylhistidine N-methyltransferase [Flavobacterium noncentrifugens]SDJ56491.1 dimethylhistidine N-methyltransferase [Flavobacterium noncentrifugens]
MGNFTTGVKETRFYNDVISGLSGFPKQLFSKYFYDAIGDKLFQQIMNCDDYYLTKCEMEILELQTEAIIDSISADDYFELVELGPGDGTKSIKLLKELTHKKADFTYIPIDISHSVIDNLEALVADTLPEVKTSGMNGDFFDMLNQLRNSNGARRVVLCLGGNIGNMTVGESHAFCGKLRQSLSKGDKIIFGFDLVKNPKIIRRAYDDSEGITKRFNLNLLERMNRELCSDFDVKKFEHYCSYDPETGSCKSYLVCLQDLEVHFPEAVIPFKKDEYIHMEISQKYTLSQISDMAHKTGFVVDRNFFDSKKWYVDSVWEAV